MASTRRQPGLDDYVIGEVIGHGLAGPVRVGRYLPTGMVVAVEAVPAALAADARFAAALASTGRIAATIHDPSIAAVYDLLDVGGTLRVVGELAPGTPLASITQTAGILPLPAALTIIDGILAALEVAHRHRLVHGAISPDTVTIAPDGRIRVTGFAVAAAVAASRDRPPTPSRSRRRRTAATGPARSDDLWATATLALQLLEPEPEKRAQVTRLSSALRAAIDRSLSIDARRRYLTAASFRTALSAAAVSSIGRDWRVPRALAQLAAEQPPDVSARPSPSVEAVSPRPERPRSRFLRPGALRLAMAAGAIGLGAAVALPIAAAIGPGLPASGPLLLHGDLAMKVAPAVGSCNTTLVFVATGSLQGQGALVYRWERSDGSTTGDRTQRITSTDGSYRLTERWQLQSTPPATATMTLRILSPTSMQASRSVSIACP